MSEKVTCTSLVDQDKANLAIIYKILAGMPSTPRRSNKFLDVESLTDFTLGRITDLEKWLFALRVSHPDLARVIEGYLNDSGNSKRIKFPDKWLKLATGASSNDTIFEVDAVSSARIAELFNIYDFVIKPTGVGRSFPKIERMVDPMSPLAIDVINQQHLSSRAEQAHRKLFATFAEVLTQMIVPIKIVAGKDYVVSDNWFNWENSFTFFLRQLRGRENPSSDLVVTKIVKAIKRGHPNKQLFMDEYSVLNSRLAIDGKPYQIHQIPENSLLEWLQYEIRMVVVERLMSFVPKVTSLAFKAASAVIVDVQSCHNIKNADRTKIVKFLRVIYSTWPLSVQRIAASFYYSGT